MSRTAGRIRDTQNVKGIYILLIELREEESISTGSLGSIRFPGSHYAYVGSALNGIRPRVKRHLRKDKKLHWHIDYLLQKAAITGIIVCETDMRVECGIAQALSRRFKAVQGFGSSDCRCCSHLFFDEDEKLIAETVMEALRSLNLEGGYLDAQTYSFVEA